MPLNLCTIYLKKKKIINECLIFQINYLFLPLWWFLCCKVLPRFWHISPDKMFAACSRALNIKLTGCNHWFKSLFARDFGNKDNKVNLRMAFSFVSLISIKNVDQKKLKYKKIKKKIFLF